MTKEHPTVLCEKCQKAQDHMTYGARCTMDVQLFCWHDDSEIIKQKEAINVIKEQILKKNEKKEN
jgi:hypothetical protein